MAPTIKFEELMRRNTEYEHHLLQQGHIAINLLKYTAKKEETDKMLGEHLHASVEYKTLVLESERLDGLIGEVKQEYLHATRLLEELEKTLKNIMEEFKEKYLSSKKGRLHTPLIIKNASMLRTYSRMNKWVHFCEPCKIPKYAAADVGMLQTLMKIPGLVGGGGGGENVVGKVNVDEIDDLGSGGENIIGEENVDEVDDLGGGGHNEVNVSDVADMKMWMA